MNARHSLVVNAWNWLRALDLAQREHAEARETGCKPTAVITDKPVLLRPERVPGFGRRTEARGLRLCLPVPACATEITAAAGAE